MNLYNEQVISPCNLKKLRHNSLLVTEVKFVFVLNKLVSGN